MADSAAGQSAAALAHQARTQTVDAARAAADAATVVAQQVWDQASVVAQQSRVHGAVAARQAAAAATTAASEARGHAVATARSGASAVGAFLLGIGYFWVGGWRFLRSPVLWFFAVVPALLTVFFLALTEAGSATVTDLLLELGSRFTDHWPGLARAGTHVVMEFVVHRIFDATVAFLALPVSIIVGAPFYVLLARHLDRRLTGSRPEHRPGWIRASLFAMGQAIRLTLLTTVAWFLLAVLLPVPGVNVIATVGIVVVVDGFLVGLLTLAIPLHYRGARGFRAHLRFGWRHKMHVLGFGTTSMLALALPYAPVHLLATPVVFVGSVLLHHRITRRPSPPSAPSPQSIMDGPGRPTLNQG